jgi:hypothetical protein
MGAQITAITGLQNLTNLQDFRADWNALETIDLSGLTNLTYLDVSDCEELGSTGLKSMNITGCTALQSLYIDDNDFSAGFPDLSSCTSLQYFDADQCILQGSIDLSNLPALKGFDLSGNTNLTEIIISSTQPLGNGQNVNFGNCSSLTQTALDNILQQLASSSVSNGYIYFENTDIPSLERGIPALATMVDNKGWSLQADTYSETKTTTDVYGTSGEACTALTNNQTIGLYVYTGTNVEVGNRIFTDSRLHYPVTDGFIGNVNDGLYYQVSGSNGLIVASGSCV